MAITASQMIAYQKKQLGNGGSKYNRWIGFPQGTAWCATFQCYNFWQTGMKSEFNGGAKSGYCPTVDNWYKNHARHVSSIYNGRAGDIIFFDWSGKHHDRDHIGIILKKTSTGYTTLEGNTGGGSGRVMIRHRSFYYVCSIDRPRYAKATNASNGTTGTKKLKVDGNWGKATTTRTQRVLGTVQDGIISHQLISCRKYLKAANTSSWEFVKRSKSGSDVIKAIQKLVGTKRDGFAGKKTIKAMQKFLTKKKLYTGKISGYMGVETVKAWQKYINSKL